MLEHFYSKNYVRLLYSHTTYNAYVLALSWNDGKTKLLFRSYVNSPVPDRLHNGSFRIYLYHDESTIYVM